MSDFEELLEKVGGRGFAVIEDGVKSRPLLKTDDLRLIREAFLVYCRSGLAGSDELKCRELLKRMLRKVK